eukprot:TRINITY_DN2632_c1_g2_i1.p1 TRINITY_DN2632_c1_g2~~TRINITY_DN2632_c1_g2_i1.p1  ORF type:complete len:308 (+),score=51.94 TRINITY_DN2632_c1_g2_i1:207-1130(+)
MECFPCKPFSTMPMFQGRDFDAGSSGVGRQKQVDDAVHSLKVSLEDLYNGTIKKLSLSRNVSCPTCEGKGSKSGASRGCWECLGSGTMRNLVPVDSPLIVEIVEEVCSDCRGLGEIISEDDKCTRCKGSKVTQEEKVLEVLVEKGMEHGQKIVFPGEANEALNVVTGDIVVVLQLEEHPMYKRKFHDLYVEHTLGLAEALCGFQFSLTHIDGRELLIKSDPGEIIKPGQLKAINDEGMPHLMMPSMKGCLYICFKVEFPDSGFFSLDQCDVLKTILPTKQCTRTPTMEMKLDECEAKVAASTTARSF